MLSTAEKIVVLVVREIRLTARSRSRLLCLLAVPLAGGFVCGWMTRTTSLPPIYCLAVFLVLAAAVLSAGPATAVPKALASIAGPRVYAASWALSALVYLVIQALMLTACASLIGGFQVSTGVFAGIIVLSLGVSAAVRQVIFD